MYSHLEGVGSYTSPGVNTLKEVAVACDLTFQKDDTSLESWHQCKTIHISASLLAVVICLHTKSLQIPERNCISF